MSVNKVIAELFEVSVSVINQHLKNIFESNELVQNLLIKNLLIVRQESNRQVKRDIEHYNFDAIIGKASTIEAFFQFAQEEQKREAKSLIQTDNINEEKRQNAILSNPLRGNTPVKTTLN